MERIPELLFQSFAWLLNKKREGELSVWMVMVVIASIVFAGYIGWSIFKDSSVVGFALLMTLIFASCGYLIGVAILWFSTKMME